MESMLIDYVASAGDLITAVVVLVFVFGDVLLRRLFEEERAGMRFFWAEWPLPESDETDLQEIALRAA